MKFVDVDHVVFFLFFPFLPTLPARSPGSFHRPLTLLIGDSPGNPFIQRKTPTSTSTSTSTLGNTNINFNKAGPGTIGNTNAATRTSEFGRKLQEVSSSSIHNNIIVAEIDTDNQDNDDDDSAFHDTLNGRRRFSTRSAMSRGEDSIFEAQPGDGSRMVDGQGHGHGAETANDEYDPAIEFRTSWEVSLF